MQQKMSEMKCEIERWTVEAGGRGEVICISQNRTVQVSNLLFSIAALLNKSFIINICIESMNHISLGSLYAFMLCMCVCGLWIVGMGANEYLSDAYSI